MPGQVNAEVPRPTRPYRAGQLIANLRLSVARFTRQIARGLAALIDDDDFAGSLLPGQDRLDQLDQEPGPIAAANDQGARREGGTRLLRLHRIRWDGVHGFGQARRAWARSARPRRSWLTPSGWIPGS